MKLKRINTHLYESQIKRLKKAAKKSKPQRDRAELIRRGVDLVLDELEKGEKNEQP